MIGSENVEVQNHTYNIHSTRKGRIGCMQRHAESLEKYEQVLADDIISLQNKIFSYTGKLPNTFTYPYGRSSKNTDAIIKELGFQATLSCDYGINLITKDPKSLFGLKRICRSHGVSLRRFLKEAFKTIK